MWNKTNRSQVNGTEKAHERRTKNNDSQGTAGEQDANWRAVGEVRHSPERDLQLEKNIIRERKPTVCRHA